MAELEEILKIQGKKSPWRWVKLEEKIDERYSLVYTTEKKKKILTK